MKHEYCQKREIKTRTQFVIVFSVVWQKYVSDLFAVCACEKTEGKILVIPGAVTPNLLCVQLFSGFYLSGHGKQKKKKTM